MSQTAHLNEIAVDQWLLTGQLDFKSVPPLSQAPQAWLATKQLTIDLSGVEYSNTAGLVLLIAWLRFAKRNAITMNFINPPAQMRAIAKLSGLEAILKI